MRYLCACLAKSRKHIVDLSQFTEKIFNFKQKTEKKYEYLFEDIEFRKSFNGVVSYSINEAINNLQTFGIIGKFNPTYEKFVIYFTEEEANKILQVLDTDIKNAIELITQDF